MRSIGSTKVRMGLVGALAACAAAVGSVTSTAPAAAAPAPPRFVAPASAASGGTVPEHLAAADFDGDGKTDVASANEGPIPLFGSSVGVNLGDGAGGISPPVATNLPQGWGACDLTAGRFDASAGDDLVVLSCTTGGKGPIFALTSDGDGSFTVSQQIASSTDGALAGADFDGDGNRDFAFGQRGAAQVRVYLGNANGTFDAPITMTPDFDGYDLMVGDVNGDGAPDLVGAAGGPVWTMLNAGNGTFGAQIYDFSSQLSGIELTLDDFDADGKLDVAVVDASGGNVDIGLGQGNGHFTPVQQVALGTLQVIWVTSGDVTNDGRIDIVAGIDSDSSALLAGMGDGTFGKATRWVTGSQDVTMTDLDGKGGADLVAFLPDPGRVYATVAARKGFAAAQLTPGPSTEDLRDVNRDGRLDKVSGTTGVSAPGKITSQVIVQLNRSRGRFGPPIVTKVRGESAGSGIGDVDLADIDEDGILDVVGGFSNFQPNASNLFWMTGNGDGTFDRPTLANTGDVNADIVSLAAVDVTGDGHADIVAHTLTQLSVRPGNGVGGFGAPVLSGSSGPAQTATLVADFTGDGVPDVVAVIRTSGEDFASSDIRLEQGSGNGTFALVQTRSIDSNVSEGDVAVFDADGRADVIVVGSRGSNGGRSAIWVLLGTATGRLGTPTPYEGPASGLAVADFNLDGAPDFATNGNDTITIYANAGNGTFAPAISMVSSGSVGAAGDVTGDGAPDLIGGSSIGAFAVYVNAM